MAKKTVDEGLLFYLSGDTSEADYAKGEKKPTLFMGAESVPHGVKGRFLKCNNGHRISWRAPGNIYAERGTVSFFWRSEIPLGFAPFPVFRVSFADHSSWDQVFLRIDYNGQQQGFDAFVTDINSSRIRLRTTMHPALEPMEWVHIGFSWDENVGVKLYLNGILAEYRYDKRVLYAALDSFAPHQRISANWGIQSAFQFIRGGDLDELRIYDRMLSDENMLELASCKPLTDVPSVPASMESPEVRQEWYQRYGWDHADAQPQYYTGNVSARKVMPVTAFERGLWTYKTMDGIRETAWPNMFNRSRLPGRNDYFQLPDWNCYYDSGKEIIWTMPSEKYNHIEIEGSAFGTLSVVGRNEEKPLAERKRFRQYTVTDLDTPLQGKKIHFRNVVLEEPISSFGAYYVKRGNAPADPKRIETFRINACSFAEAASAVQDAAVTGDAAELVQFINRRYLPNERNILFGTADTVIAPSVGPDEQDAAADGMPSALPIVQIILPYDNTAHDGLDGILLDIPALDCEDTLDGFINLHIEIKDPLWKYRDLAVFTMNVKAGEAKRLWLDLRDRILPADKAMCIVIAASAGDFSGRSLTGMNISLYYKDQKAALAEHVEDGLNRVKDCYGNLVEEHAAHPRFYMYERLIRDLTDVLRYDPDNELGRNYLYEIVHNLIGGRRGTDNPDTVEYNEKGTLRGVKLVPVPYEAEAPAEGIEPWAHYQLLVLKRIKYIVDWWTDNRMIENGELGGGLSDDGDQMELWLMLSALGIKPEYYADKHYLQMDAYYDQGMFLDGHTMILTDSLHTYEDGIQMLTQEMLYEPWKPRNFERALETLRANWRICEYAPNGDLQIVSRYFSGNTIIRSAPWDGMDPMSLLILGPGLGIAAYCGLKPAVRLNMELADTLMHHFHDGYMHATIEFMTGKDKRAFHSEWANQLTFAYHYTRDPKYLVPIAEHGDRSLNMGDDSYGEKVWTHPTSETFDKDEVVGINKDLDERLYRREYINTEGYTWSDRLIRYILETQWERIGGVIEERNYQFPMSTISWKFANEEDALLVGIMLPYSDLGRIKIVAFNTSDRVINAEICGKMVDPGTWRISCGIDSDGDQSADTDMTEQTVYFENYQTLPVAFKPKQTTVIDMKLVDKALSYYERPDLAIGKEDVAVKPKQVVVTVHSIGAVDAPKTKIALLDERGREVTRTTVPAMNAPNDMYAKTARVILRAAAKKGYKVVIDPDHELFEVTRINNEIVIEG